MHQSGPGILRLPHKTFVQIMKRRIAGILRLTHDLPGLCILLQSCAAIGLAVALGWLFVTSELGRF